MDDFKQSYTVAPAPQRLVPYSRPWYLTRVLMRTASFVLSAAVIGLSSKVKSTDTRWYDDYRGWKSALPAGILVLLYNFVELTVFAFRYKVRRGVHPGVSVAGDLVLWLGCALAAFFNIATNNYLWERMTGIREGDFSERDLANEVLLCMLGVMHLILFVRSCIETRQRNASKGEDLYVYMYTPGGGPPIPVLPMKDQGGDYNDGQQSEVGTEWGGAASTIRHSVVSPSVGVTERNTVMSLGTRAPSSIAPSMPTAPPSAYGMGDGFSGYQGPTDEVEVHGYHAHYGQKEIMPNGRRR